MLCTQESKKSMRVTFGQIAHQGAQVVGWFSSVPHTPRWCHSGSAWPCWAEQYQCWPSRSKYLNNGSLMLSSVLFSGLMICNKSEWMSEKLVDPKHHCYCLLPFFRFCHSLEYYSFAWRLQMRTYISNIESYSKFNRRTFHEPYFIVTMNFMESTPSESTEYILYYMVRLDQPYLYSPAE